jgi:hypothetical protein
MILLLLLHLILYKLVLLLINDHQDKIIKYLSVIKYFKNFFILLLNLVKIFSVKIIWYFKKV